jgi:hypothetical protein
MAQLAAGAHPARLKRRESRSRRAAEELLAVRAMARTALICALAGCAYQPGSFTHGFRAEAALAAQRATVGCLDLAIARGPDLDASAVLRYWFGNRCNRPVRIDLQRVAVVGHLGDGREVALAPYDPQGELRSASLGGRRDGGEAIAYRAHGPVARVCVDAASIAHARPAWWMCFGTSEAAP